MTTPVTVQPVPRVTISGLFMGILGSASGALNMSAKACEKTAEAFYHAASGLSEGAQTAEELLNLNRIRVTASARRNHESDMAEFNTD